MQRETLDHATLGIGQRLYDNERGFIQVSGNRLNLNSEVEDWFMTI